MNKTISILTSFLTLSFAALGQEISIPDNYSIVESVIGDLNKDDIDELVVVYNIGTENDIEGVSRELIIYKAENEKWTVWKKSRQAILASNSGGVWGDPFEEITIRNGILHITHYGGSRWRWGYIDKYRFQNGEFYLIGFASLYGAPCEYFETVDFNLATGKILVKKEFQACNSEEEFEVSYKKENETLFETGLQITLEFRQETNVKIVTPKYGHIVELRF